MPLLHDDVLRRLARARERLCDQVSDAPPLAELARAAGLSEKHFRRLFERAYGITPGRFSSELRIRRAKELLARGASVTEACMRAGYSSLGSFSSKFSLVTGRSPRCFAREARALGSVPVRLVSLYVPMCFVSDTSWLPRSLPGSGGGP